jgi:hypothetical protein
VASTIVLLIAIWALTVPAVLIAARLLGRWSGPRTLEADADGPARAATRPVGNVVPLVPRPQNALVPRPVEPLREAI